MMARRKIVSISIEMLQEMLTQGWSIGGDLELFECTEGLPEGARPVGIWAPDNNCTAVCLVFEHPDWPKVDAGQPLPRLDVVHKRTPWPKQVTWQLEVLKSDVEVIGETTFDSLGGVDGALLFRVSKDANLAQVEYLAESMQELFPKRLVLVLSSDVELLRARRVATQ